MKLLELKAVSFYPDKIVIKRIKGNVVIPTEEIVSITYNKPNFWTYFFLVITSLPSAKLNWLEISLSNAINGTDYYVLRVKYKDVLKIQEILDKQILIRNAS